MASVQWQVDSGEQGGGEAVASGERGQSARKQQRPNLTAKGYTSRHHKQCCVANESSAQKNRMVAATKSRRDCRHTFPKRRLRRGGGDGERDATLASDSYSVTVSEQPASSSDRQGCRSRLRLRLASRAIPSRLQSRSSHLRSLAVSDLTRLEIPNAVCERDRIADECDSQDAQEGTPPIPSNASPTQATACGSLGSGYGPLDTHACIRRA